MVLVATVTHPYQTPSAAAEVADRLGTSGAAALDIGAACAGFCYGLALASDMIRAGSARYVILIGVEKLTDWVDLDGPRHRRSSSPTAPAPSSSVRRTCRPSARSSGAPTAPRRTPSR